MRPLSHQRWITSLLSISTLGATLLLGACATAYQPPTAKIAAAELAVQQAEEGRARDFAPLDLRFARDKLNKAKVTVSSGDDYRFQEAGQLADEALMDARLAEAKARTARAKKLEEEMQKSIDELRREATR